MIKSWDALLLASFSGIVAGCSDEPVAAPLWFEADVAAEVWWSVELGVGGRSLVHVAPDGRAALGTPDGRVFIEPSPGEWPSAHGPFEGLQEQVLTPAVWGDWVLMRNVDGDLLAVDAAQDAVLWQSVDHLPIVANTAEGPVAVMRRNTVDPAIHGRDLEAGVVLWTIEYDGDVFDPQSANGARVCGVSDSEVMVINAASGEVLWATPHVLGAPSVTTSFEPRCTTTDVGVLVVGEGAKGGDFELILFGADGVETARAIWPLPQLPVQVVPRADGRVVGWSDAAMIIYDGELREESRFEDRSPAAVDAASGNMYLNTEGGMVLTDADFTPIWAGGLDQPDLAYREIGITVVGDRVYVADAQDGVLGQARWTRYAALGPPR